MPDAADALDVPRTGRDERGARPADPDMCPAPEGTDAGRVQGVPFRHGGGCGWWMIRRVKLAGDDNKKRRTCGPF